jgi:hypothetical protein
VSSCYPSQHAAPSSRSPVSLNLSDWLNQIGLTFILDDDRIIEGDLLYKPTWDKEPFDRANLTPFDWAGTSFTVESQTKDRLTHSIQYRAIAELRLRASRGTSSSTMTAPARSPTLWPSGSTTKGC